MTVVFKDENIYTHLKVEAAKRNINASDIVSEEVVEWIESQEDLELSPLKKNSQEEIVEPQATITLSQGREFVNVIKSTIGF